MLQRRVPGTWARLLHPGVTIAKAHSSGTRATPPPGPGFGPPPKSFRERLGALRNVPPFLSLVWQTSPAFTIAEVALRLARALLPVVTLYVGKLIIDEVIGLARGSASPGTLQTWFASGLPTTSKSAPCIVGRATAILAARGTTSA